MTLSLAYERCTSEESCVAVQTERCDNTKALICGVPTSGVPFRKVDPGRNYCVYEKGNIQKTFRIYLFLLKDFDTYTYCLIFGVLLYSL